ncbi:uncharacterized protein LOC110431046 isoform X5 [Sorghum bicolor]|uniref:uncharacterized protein LOC110431046 isoform X5 n=1 Tax=Sorghum bicolor TaxID=4558 RepID=UPI000B425947|nr:uncharacterized protein LOC110431046 isoform X5 [Sorghum bicolor]|eukprot:XP_021305318.1 uncharacterized protein LOC110431046 isoform X5 [Sorghum bicolor]
MGATGAPRPPSSSSLPPFPSSVGGGAPGDGVACRRGDDTVLVPRRENPSSCHSVMNCFRVHMLQIFPTSHAYRNRSIFFGYFQLHALTEIGFDILRNTLLTFSWATYVFPP